jgi:hypothetical protein
VNAHRPEAAGVTLWPRAKLDGSAAPVTYPQANGWKGASNDALSIYEGADIVATWDAGTWDHIEMSDARTDPADDARQNDQLASIIATLADAINTQLARPIDSATPGEWQRVHGALIDGAGMALQAVDNM